MNGSFAAAPLRRAAVLPARSVVVRARYRSRNPARASGEALHTTWIYW